VRIEIIPQMPMTAVGKIFKPRLRHLAIERVCDEVLRASGIEATVTARDDKRRGTVASICLANAASQGSATDALARLPAYPEDTAGSSAPEPPRTRA
jgi:hypothetical protein